MALHAALTRSRAGALASRTRAVWVFSGDPDWLTEQVALALAIWQPADGLRVGQAQLAPVCETLNRAHQVLGREVDCLIWDARSGFDPDLFAAAAGTVRAGGLCALLIPDWSAWPHWQDPVELRQRVAAAQPVPVAGHFIRRVAQVLQTHPGVSWCHQASGKTVFAAVPPALPEPWLPDGRPNRDQQAVIDAALQVCRGHSGRPLVITADRGRGKTAALGMAAARLLQNDAVTLWVTAPHRANVEPLFRHASQALGLSYQPGQTQLCTAQGGMLLYRAPDAVPLQADLPRGTVHALWVDEAAALSPHLLTRYLARFQRLVFATTLHGYEGSGRGFELRFLDTLSRRFDDVVKLTLQEPVRWATGDPLEAVLNLAFLLKPAGADGAATTPPTTPPTTGSADASPVLSVTRLSQAQLAQDEALLTAVFHLLLDAHYRTQPSDLRDMLDGANLSLWVARAGNELCGVVLAADEGGLSAELDAQVWQGKRRPRGHQIPQTLVAQLGMAGQLTHRFVRVVRIAVAPGWRGQGVARRLLNALEAHYQTTDVQALGALFGATPDLLQFWQRCGYRPVRLGFSHQPSTGEHSVLVLKQQQPAPWLVALQERFRASFCLHLADAFRDLDTELARLVLASSADPNLGAPTGLAEWMREEFAAFCQGRRYFAACAVGIAHWVQAHLDRLAQLPNQEQRLVIARVLQKQCHPQIARTYALAGQRGVEAALRTALQRMASAESSSSLPEPGR